VDNLCEACVFALEDWQPGPEELQFLNVGIGVDFSIRELAEAVAAATESKGTMWWDTSKPDGTSKKQLDIRRFEEHGYKLGIDLKEEIKTTAEDFNANSVAVGRGVAWHLPQIKKGQTNVTAATEINQIQRQSRKLCTLSLIISGIAISLE